MSLTIALVSAALALGPLPDRGLALETEAGVQLQSLGGRPLAALRGFDLAFDQAAAHVVVLRNRRGALYSFDGHTLRPRARRRTGHWIWREPAAGSTRCPCAASRRVCCSAPRASRST